MPMGPAPMMSASVFVIDTKIRKAQRTLIR